jgi:phage terminase large subunit-like protein
MSAVRIKRKELHRPVVALDPAVTVSEDADESGIIVVARGPHQPTTCPLEECPGHGYVLEDLTCKAMPPEIAKIAIGALDRWNATRIVAEVNNGGEWIGAVVKAQRSSVSYEVVRASKGKETRAQPAAALYEQGRIHHLGEFPELEEQLTTWTPDGGESPDRLDALVWGLTALKLIGATPGPVLFSPEELGAIKAAEARAFGEKGPVRAIPGRGFGGDIDMAPSVARLLVDTDGEIVPDVVEPGAKPNGKVVRSPFV